jgi:hypothetical protein
MGGGAGPVDQQRLGGATNAGAAQLRIDDDPRRPREVGGAIDIDVHDALEVGEDRDTRLALDAFDQASAAARHDHVERAAQTVEHFAYRVARCERRTGDRRLRQAGAAEPGDQAGMNRRR